MLSLVRLKRQRDDSDDESAPSLSHAKSRRLLVATMHGNEFTPVFNDDTERLPDLIPQVTSLLQHRGYQHRSLADSLEDDIASYFPGISANTIASMNLPETLPDKSNANVPHTVPQPFTGPPPEATDSDDFEVYVTVASEGGAEQLALLSGVHADDLFVSGYSDDEEFNMDYDNDSNDENNYANDYPDEDDDMLYEADSD